MFMLRNVPFTSLISDMKVRCKHIRHTFNLVFVIIEVYICLISFMMFVSLNSSGVNRNLAFI